MVVHSFTITEFPALDYPGHQVAVAQKIRCVINSSNWRSTPEPQKPKELGAHLLMLLLDGAFVERRLYGQSGFRTGLTVAATILINSQLK